MTEQELNEELDKCQNDLLYFVQKYTCVLSEDGFRHPLNLRDYQRKMIYDLAIKGKAVVYIKNKN